ncbi:hypothetical protein [Ramlibacter sp.]|uniref:hypothetical protein n=1 Tax=Ramlibacter sp. TaxID=1917967 RepID=UPI0017ECFC0C|nr:hypothetical protein [Ramlibacter sp.]MBA2675685.1 hypothetical protein [Ramlibacter sp.]
MNLTDQLRLWGATHAQARAAETAARQHGADASADLHREARALRERADHLHREIYRDIGAKPRSTHG